MTDVNSLTIERDNFKKENDALKAQLDQNSKGVENLLAQLDAHKGMLNESLNACVNMRTHLIIEQKKAQETAGKMGQLGNQITTLTQQLADANAKIATLETPAA